MPATLAFTPHMWFNTTSTICGKTPMLAMPMATVFVDRRAAKVASRSQTRQCAYPCAPLGTWRPRQRFGVARYEGDGTNHTQKALPRRRHDQAAHIPSANKGGG